MTLTTLPSLLMNVSTMSLLKLMYFSSTFGIHFIYFLQFCRDSWWKDKNHIHTSCERSLDEFWFLEIEVAFVVSYFTILFCEMTVVSHFVIITIFEFLFANTTDLWIFEMFHVCICEDHILQKIELFPNQSSSLLFVLRITGSCLNNFSSKRRENKNHMVCAVDIN